MRRLFLAGLTFCGLSLASTAQILPAAARSTAAPLPPSQNTMPGPSADLPPEVEQALGVGPLLQQLRVAEAQQSATSSSGQPASEGVSITILLLRQQILERLLAASFDVDSVLGRIDTEASYSDEDRYVLQIHAQRQANFYNLVTFAASGALGAAGNAMQLTRGLNHAGTALSAAGGGTALVLSGAQLLGGGGGKQAIRSPYNMLAEILGETPNAESRYPPLVLAYLQAPRPGGQTSIADGLTAAWQRLHRLQTGSKGDGAAIKSLTADRSANLKLSSDDLADREAMLHDLRANITLLHADLQSVLLAITLPQATDTYRSPLLPRRPALPPTQ
ncbi:MAG: hypothetical protein ACRYFU_14765 [Janthinobacterium lividum]